MARSVILVNEAGLSAKPLFVRLAQHGLLFSVFHDVGEVVRIAQLVPAGYGLEMTSAATRRELVAALETVPSNAHPVVIVLVDGGPPGEYPVEVQVLKVPVAPQFVAHIVERALQTR